MSGWGQMGGGALGGLRALSAISSCSKSCMKNSSTSICTDGLTGALSASRKAAHSSRVSNHFFSLSCVGPGRGQEEGGVRRGEEVKGGGRGQGGGAKWGLTT